MWSKYPARPGRPGPLAFDLFRSCTLAQVAGSMIASAGSSRIFHSDSGRGRERLFPSTFTHSVLFQAIRPTYRSLRSIEWSWFFAHPRPATFLLEPSWGARICSEFKACAMACKPCPSA